MGIVHIPLIKAINEESLISSQDVNDVQSAELLSSHPSVPESVDEVLWSILDLPPDLGASSSVASAGSAAEGVVTAFLALSLLLFPPPYLTCLLLLARKFNIGACVILLLFALFGTSDAYPFER